MRPTWIEPERQATLKRRGLDFAQTEQVFAGPTFTFEDARQDYGEQRWVTLGLLYQLRLAVVHYTAVLDSGWPEVMHPWQRQLVLDDASQRKSQADNAHLSRQTGIVISVFE